MNANPTTALLVERSDRRSLLFVAVALALLVYPVYVPIADWLVAPWLLLSTLFCFSSCIINHNHVHVPMFRHGWLNKLFAIILTLARGHTSYGVIVAHNFNHHHFNGRDGDWISTRLAGKQRGFPRLLRYIVRASLSMARGRRAGTTPQLPVAQARQLRLQRLVLIVFLLLLLGSGGVRAVLFVLLPWGLAIAMLVGVNLLQHDACNPTRPLDLARNFVGRSGNWFFFNNGYHTIHHMQPDLHWSRLPQAHKEKVAGQASPQLQCRSILQFLFMNYVLMGNPQQTVTTPGMSEHAK